MRKYQDENVFSKIEIYDNVLSGYDSIYELYDTLKIFNRGYENFTKFNPVYYLHESRSYRNALDYFSKKNGVYSRPMVIWNNFLDNTERLLSISEKEDHVNIRDVKIRYSDKLLEEVHHVLTFYFVKLIDGDVLANF